MRGSAVKLKNRVCHARHRQVDHLGLPVCRLPVAAATQTGVGTGRLDEGEDEEDRRFRDMLRRLVAVPKKEVEERMEEYRSRRQAEELSPSE